MTKSDKKKQKLRNNIIGLMLAFLFLIIASRAVYIQTIGLERIKGQGNIQGKGSLTVYGKRGTILDANYQEMAMSCVRDAYSIGASPKKVREKQKTAAELAGILKIDEKKLYKKFISGKKFVWVKLNVVLQTAEKIRARRFAGINFTPTRLKSRIYPNGTMAAQVIGFAGADNKGLEGLEYHYNQLLQGGKDESTFIRDAMGRRVTNKNGYETNTGYNDGKNIVLTIDSRIQHITEYALGESVKKFSAKSGIAIVMVPKTGAILAMANCPFFDPNHYNKFGMELWRNRAVTDCFEPGSTMKIFTAAAVLESKKYTPGTLFYCENGEYRVGRKIVHDTHEHGYLSLLQVIKYSSNIGVVKAVEFIGKKSLYNGLHAFGFGEKTGIDCPGERTGYVPHFRRWKKIDAGNIAFGQGVSVTALQLISGVCAVANGGVFMTPYMVQAITDHNDGVIETFAPKIARRVISEKDAGEIIKIMKSVVSEKGTGVNAALDDYSVCGKTGTAQKIGKDGKYSKKQYVASFVGFAPAARPEVAVLVIIDEPEKEYYGGTVAAPAFKDIIDKTLYYLNIPLENRFRPNLLNKVHGNQ